MKQSLKLKIYYCAILNPQTERKVAFIKDGALVVKNKKIYWWGEKARLPQKIKGATNKESENLKGKIILPALFDMHFHWVQDHVRTLPKKDLLNWLTKYAWPFEEKYKKRSYSRKNAKRFFQRLVSVGTLGGGCFSSIHGHALEDAFKYAQGDFVIGHVLMTMNAPAYLSQSSENAMRLIKKYAQKYKEKYAFTPRFAITVDPQVMKVGSSITLKSQGFIQTHLAENKEEIRFVLKDYKRFKGFEKVKSYTEIYHQCGLLHKRSFMAHGIHLTNSELRLLGKTQTAIIHCPTSNAPIKELGLGSGLMDYKKLKKYNIPWALGSDIGGGPFLSMFDVMRSFVAQNKKFKPTYTQALYRSTIASAKLLQIAKTQGNLDRGKGANFVLLDLPNCQKTASGEIILKKIITTHQKNRNKYDSLVKRTYLNGQRVY